jgi:sialate O-acetylesterase
MKMFVRRFTLVAIIAMSWASAQAAVKLPAVIGENMVLQRDQPIPIWGWDAPGSEVTVTLGDVKEKTKADADGKFMVKLPARKAGGPLTMTVAGSDTVTLKNILVGEVWLCSGQSNMEWSVAASDNGTDEIAAANHPRIRHIKIPRVPADKPQSDVMTNGWQEWLYGGGLLLCPAPARAA